MKSSRYNISTSASDGDETILFNALYGTTIVVDKDTLHTVNEILDKPDCACTKAQLDVLTSLVKGKFIVHEDTNELEIIKHRKLSGMKDKNRVDVIVMPNFDCNFACPYCYESHDHSKRMAKDVETAITKWLGKLIDTHKVILLNWFGGEPLLSYKTILSIGGYAHERCKERGVSLLSHITTNGYAFNKTIIAQLIDIEIFSYQITVDGPPDIHNRTRILKSGGGSFERVYSNILQLVEADKRVKISLRVNYNHNNLHSIPELLSLFPPSVRPQLRVVYEPIFGNSELSATKNISAEEISSSVAKYYALASKMGFDVVLGGLGIGKLVYCYAEREEQYIVNYNGEVFKCSVSDFSSSNRVGYISGDGDFIKDGPKWDTWVNMKLFEDKCEPCVFLPLCMGGCRKDRLENKDTGSYCHLVPTNTSYALKSIAYGSFNELLKKEVMISRNCAKNKQSLG